MLYVFTLAVMLIVAYYYWREGLFNAVCSGVCVFLAGLIAFNFWEPLAGWIEVWLDRGPLQGYEDFICLLLLFAISLAMLRSFTNSINYREIDYLPMVNQVGGGAVGLITGYLLAGFLICAMETLPWSQSFLNFEPYQEQEQRTRSLMPPDRLWLALMHRAGDACLSRGEGYTTFDPNGTFESNYYYNRRYSE
jgi:uncharacterized membrane protein required for colicin V production